MKSTSPAAGTIIRAWPSDHSSVSSRKRTARAGDGAHSLTLGAKRSGWVGSVQGPRQRVNAGDSSPIPSGGGQGMAHFVDGGKWGVLFERSDLTLHGAPRLAAEYRRTVRSAGKSRISARTACRSAARAFSAVGTL